MNLPEEGRLLRIFIGEKDKHEGMLLKDWIVRKAREFEMAGATILRGRQGYGAHSRIHMTSVLRLSEDLPIVIEIVDTPEKIESFFPLIDNAVKEGLATIHPVSIRFYRSGTEEKSE